MNTPHKIGMYYLDAFSIERHRLAMLHYPLPKLLMRCESIKAFMKSLPVNIIMKFQPVNILIESNLFPFPLQLLFSE